MKETRILVVDDEQEIADLLELYLISDGYQVVKSSDALEGLAIMEREKIDLVLLDIMMPKMDGSGEAQCADYYGKCQDTGVR